MRRRASCSTRPSTSPRFAPAIRMQAVLTHAMPPNNLTEMTDAERARARAAGWPAPRSPAIEGRATMATTTEARRGG